MMPIKYFGQAMAVMAEAFHIQTTCIHKVFLRWLVIPTGRHAVHFSKSTYRLPLALFRQSTR